MIIAHNKHRIGISTEYKRYCEIDDRKGDVLLGNQTRDLVIMFLPIESHELDFRLSTKTTGFLSSGRMSTDPKR